MASKLVIGWKDVEELRSFDKYIKAMGSKFAVAGMRAINRTGDTTKTRVRRALSKQTGLKQQIVGRALKVKKASTSNLIYEISAKGGDISLKYFSARETRQGVSANPFGKRRLFAHTFIRGGRFPNRAGLVGGGHVFERKGGRGLPLYKIRSGVIIPNEMVKGASQDAFNKTVKEVLPKRIAHELSRLRQ